MVVTKFLGPEPPSWYVGNGCGVLGTGILDWLFKRLGVDLTEPCRRHDWHCEILRGGPDHQRWVSQGHIAPADFSLKEADTWFRHNINIAAQLQKRSIRGLALGWAAYAVVRRFSKYTIQGGPDDG